MRIPQILAICITSLPCLAFAQASNDPTVPPSAPPSTNLTEVADGSADATLAIQTAIEQQGVATLPSGKYRITRPITLVSNQGLVGTGTIVVDFEGQSYGGADNSALYLRGDNIRVEGITIAKRFFDGSYGNGVLAESGSKNIVLRGLDISNYSARYGIYLLETTQFSVTDCYIHDFMMNADADMISDSPAGLMVKRCSDGVVANNRVAHIDVGPHGLESVSPLVPKYGPQHHQSDCMTIMQSHRVALTGNTLDRSGEGVDMLLSQECTLTGNTIRDIWFQAIKMLGVANCSITGNFVSDSYEGIGLATHGAMKQECENNAVTGNVILNIGSPGSFNDDATTRVKYHGTVGIDLGDTSRNNVIANNVIRTTVPEAKLQKAINPNSQPNIIVNNVVPEGM